MNHVAKRSGFTLIELMLAMTFISVLLLAIAMTIIQLSQIYNRGMTLKEVNQSARSLSDELKRTISSGERFDLSTNYVQFNIAGVPSSGRLCTNKYSYLWNTKSAIDANDANVIKSNGVAVRLAKVPDVAGLYCAKNTNGTMVRPAIVAADIPYTTETLNVGDHDLSIHNFTIASSTSAFDPTTSQQLYLVSFTIGTSDTTALKKSNGSLTYNACKAPNEAGSDLAYCSIQDFTIVIRAGNRVN